MFCASSAPSRDGAEIFAEIFADEPRDERRDERRVPSLGDLIGGSAPSRPRSMRRISSGSARVVGSSRPSSRPIWRIWDDGRVRQWAGGLRQ